MKVKFKRLFCSKETDAMSDQKKIKIRFNVKETESERVDVVMMAINGTKIK